MRARDLRGMTEDRWLGLAPKPATDQGPVCSTFGAGSQLISSAESAREAGRKPAVVRAKTDTKRVICRMFSTGATGLEPATSGVTGRSWWFRAERG